VRVHPDEVGTMAAPTLKIDGARFIV